MGKLYVKGLDYLFTNMEHNQYLNIPVNDHIHDKEAERK